jgi:uncharacterized membrane protein YhaH (DUF805 family)
MATALTPLRRYAEFSGRSSRREFWSFTMLVFGVLIITTLMVAGNSAGAAPALGALIILGLAVPSLAVTVRRLHDCGITGWVLLVQLVPYVGSLVLLVLTLIPGSQKDNRYGPPPPI